jgi:4-amino-4-deoxy-L-arabinose transferase-like glycosyltransferase
LEVNLKLKIVILVSLFLASLVLRVLSTNFDAQLGGDEGEYHSLATQMLEGKGFTKENGDPTAWRTPGFPFSLTIIYFFSGINANSAKIVLVIISALTTLLIYALSFFLFKRHSVALMSGIIWSILPTGIIFSGLLYGENLAAFLLILSFAITIFLLDKTDKMLFYGIILSGLLIGLAIITRGYLIFVIISLPIYLLVVKKSIKPALICLIVSMLIPTLWMTRNLFVMNSFTISTEASETIWLGNNGWTRGAWAGEWTINPNSEQRAYFKTKYPGFFENYTEAERSKIFQSEAISEITNNPRRILWLLPRKAAIYLSPNSYLGFDWVYLIILPFALLGFFLILIDKTQRHYLWLIAFPVFCVALICLLTFGDSRFRHPVDFCFVILGGVALVWIGEKSGLTTSLARFLPDAPKGKN